MKSSQPQFTPNKKLILHFDIEGVLRLPNRKNKDLYVFPSSYVHRSMISVQDGYGANLRKPVKKIPIKLPDGNWPVMCCPRSSLSLILSRIGNI